MPCVAGLLFFYCLLLRGNEKLWKWGLTEKVKSPRFHLVKHSFLNAKRNERLNEVRISLPKMSKTKRKRRIMQEIILWKVKNKKELTSSEMGFLKSWKYRNENVYRKKLV